MRAALRIAFAFPTFVLLCACFERAGVANSGGTLVAGLTTVRGPSIAGQVFHYAYPGDEGNAGSLDYRRFDPLALSIVGAGTDSLHRRVRIWDDLVVTGKTYVSSTQASLTAGLGAPRAREQIGSLYLRTDGKTGARLYVSAGKGEWHPVSGV